MFEWRDDPNYTSESMQCLELWTAGKYTGYFIMVRARYSEIGGPIDTPTKAVSTQAEAEVLCIAQYLLDN